MTQKKQQKNSTTKKSNMLATILFVISCSIAAFGAYLIYRDEKYDDRMNGILILVLISMFGFGMLGCLVPRDQTTVTHTSFKVAYFSTGITITLPDGDSTSLTSYKDVRDFDPAATRVKQEQWFNIYGYRSSRLTLEPREKEIEVK